MSKFAAWYTWGIPAEGMLPLGENESVPSSVMTIGSYAVDPSRKRDFLLFRLLQLRHMRQNLNFTSVGFSPDEK